MSSPSVLALVLALASVPALSSMPCKLLEIPRWLIECSKTKLRC
jgi:hypothetical protein